MPRAERLLSLGLALILGGALGNVIDRVMLGYVVDFICTSTGRRTLPGVQRRRQRDHDGRGAADLGQLREPRARAGAASARRNHERSRSCSPIPRGFCAGVDRAIDIVERALELHGAPIYVRHEVVHNQFVVDDLRARARCSSRSSTRCRAARP